MIDPAPHHPNANRYGNGGSVVLTSLLTTRATAYLATGDAGFISAVACRLPPLAVADSSADGAPTDCVLAGQPR
ncbi:hypothetical protein [Streptomyces sp. NPDC048357]|uniref:hypothetical protein n=1 Tax=Streptomyces sp. NPDC048357 TaxID=3154719 RepID=UPI003440E491